MVEAIARYIAPLDLPHVEQVHSTTFLFFFSQF